MFLVAVQPFKTLPLFSLHQPSSLPSAACLYLDRYPRVMKQPRRVKNKAFDGWQPTSLASPLTHCRLYMRRRRLISTDKRKDFEDARINWTGVQGSPDVQPNAPCTSLVNRRDDDAEKDLDGQACKGRALHHQGLVDCR